MLLRRGLVFAGPGGRGSTATPGVAGQGPLRRRRGEVVFGEYLARHEVLLARRDRLDACSPSRPGGAMGADGRPVALPARHGHADRGRPGRRDRRLHAFGTPAAGQLPRRSSPPSTPPAAAPAGLDHQGRIQHARRLLIEAAWHYRRPPRVSLTLRRRQARPAARRDRRRLARAAAPARRWAHLDAAAASAARPSPSPSRASWPASSGRSPNSPTEPDHNPFGAGVAAGAASRGTRDCAMSTDLGRRARS